MFGTFTCAVLLLNAKVFEAVVLAWGSRIVKAPPVQLMNCEFNCTIATPEATEFAATPPSLPSTRISPPLWLKIEAASCTIFPLTANRPPETVKVPLFAKVLLFNVQPTVKSPAETTKVPPVAIVTFLATLPEVVDVTVWPFAIVAKSVQVGTVPLFQVVPTFQSPEVTDTKGTSTELTPIWKGSAVNWAVEIPVLCAAGVVEPFWKAPTTAVGFINLAAVLDVTNIPPE